MNGRDPAASHRFLVPDARRLGGIPTAGHVLPRESPDAVVAAIEALLAGKSR